MNAHTGLLVIWTDVDAAAEADFNDWYDNQHLMERAAVPGFINARRYRAADGAPKYLAWYETETPDVLGAPAYGARQANPTPWTQRIMPNFRNVTRVTAAKLAKSGSGVGGAAATLRLRPAPGQENALAAALTAAPASLAGVDGVIAAQSFQPHAADAATDTAEARLRALHEEPPAWGLILEATDVEVAKSAIAAAGLEALLGAAAGDAAEVGYYQLLHARGQF